MSDPLLLILLVAGIITVVTVTEVFIFTIPVRISIAFRTGETETRGVIRGSWYISGLEVDISGNGSQLSVLLAGARLFTLPLSRFGLAEKEQKGGPAPEDIPGIISSLLNLHEPVIDALLDLVRHTRLDYARGSARIGLGDPAATGTMYGLYRAVIAVVPSTRVNLMVIPEFNREVCEIDITTLFRITYPVLALINAVKIVKHPSARKVMKKMKPKKSGEMAI
jgi:hypothetical protein